MVYERIKWLRERNRYSQREIADKINLTLNGYQKIEYGEREPKIDVLLTLSKLYDVSIDFILELDDNTNSLKMKYTELLNMKYLHHYLETDVPYKYTMNMMDEEFDKTYKFLDNVFTSEAEEVNYDYQTALCLYIFEFVTIPNYNPYNNKLLADLFPIAFISQEYEYTSSLLVIIDKNGKTIIDDYPLIINGKETLNSAVEKMNSYVNRFWKNGVPPRVTGYHQRLF